MSARTIAAPAAAIRSAFRFDEAVLTTGLNVPWETTSAGLAIPSSKDARFRVTFFLEHPNPGTAYSSTYLSTFRTLGRAFFAIDDLGDHLHSCTQHAGATMGAHEQILAVLQSLFTGLDTEQIARTCHIAAD